jgi:hypothetical protein
MSIPKAIIQYNRCYVDVESLMSRANHMYATRLTPYHITMDGLVGGTGTVGL